MNKVIKGRRYDTETAKAIAVIEFPGGFNQLFRKRNGEFFLYHYGEEEGVRPVSLDAARDFAKKILDPDQFEEVFGPVDNKKETLNLVISTASKRKLQKMALLAGCSLSAVVDTLISREWKNGRYDK